jgi:pectate lyase
LCITRLSTTTSKHPSENGGRAYTIVKGIYHEAIPVPADLRHLTIKGATGNSSDVVIYNDRAHGMAKPGGGVYGTQGSATATFRAADLTVTGVKIMNLRFKESTQRAQPGSGNPDTCVVGC